MTLDPTIILTFVRENPLIAMGCVLGVAVAIYLLQRRPRIQRDADERLAALGKANANRYDQLRPLE